MKRFQFLASIVALSMAALAGVPASANDGMSRSVVINNAGAETIVHVEMSHVGTIAWGRDLLGRSVLQAGEQAVVEPDVDQGYCRFDLRVTFADGSQRIVNGFNACEAFAVSLFDEAVWITDINGNSGLVGA